MTVTSGAVPADPGAAGAWRPAPPGRPPPARSAVGSAGPPRRSPLKPGQSPEGGKLGRPLFTLHSLMPERKGIRGVENVVVALSFHQIASPPPLWGLRPFRRFPVPLSAGKLRQRNPGGLRCLSALPSPCRSRRGGLPLAGGYQGPFCHRLRPGARRSAGCGFGRWPPPGNSAP